MPYVTIRYGPYMCYGIIDHRIQKINGLFGALDSLGYEIEVAAINEYNRLSIEMFGREVFRCDIRNLMFNLPVEDDPVCQRAVRAIEEAKVRMDTDQNIPGYRPVTSGVRQLSPDATKSPMQEMLPSKTQIMFEIPNQGTVLRSMSKHLASVDASELFVGKTEEKMSKVKIMEDKNTTFGGERLSMIHEESEKDIKAKENRNTVNPDETANDGKPEETGNNEQMEETGNKKTLEGIGNDEKLEETGNNGPLEETGNNGQLDETGNDGQMEVTGNNGQLEETGNNEQVEETANNEQLKETGNNEKLEDPKDNEQLDEM